MRLRFLPLFIVVAMLGTGVKLTDLWQTLGAPAPAFAAGAEAAGPETSNPGAAGEPAALQTDAGAEPAAAPPDEGEPDEGEPVAGVPIPESQITNLPADIFQMTDEEIVLLQSLSQRREELEQRAREIDEREVLLKAAEQRIDQRIGELERLQASIEALLVKHDEQGEAQLQSLVKIYESMKPKDAARIFEELDMEVLLEVVERMKERKTAPILAQMNPERAKTVTLELAQRRELPIPRN
jgi:flagellar motility protein MotE (MotC chaperone)